MEAQPFEGLGATIKQLKRLCVDHAEALRALEEVQKPGQGYRSDIVRNSNQVIASKTSGSDSTSYTLTRLHREAPELYEQVCAGDKSANVAAIEAGA